MAILRHRSYRKLESGQAAVEFTLMAVFLMVLIVTFLELIVFVYTYNVLADSAKEGVRYAVVHGTGSSHSGVPGTAAIFPALTCRDTQETTVKTLVKRLAWYRLTTIAW